MGCSNPHPHGQVWSLTEIPSIPGLELQKLREYANSENVELSSSSSAPRGAGGTPCLLCEYAHYETSLENQEDGRIVIKNDHWVTLVPWWAVWPFETLGEVSSHVPRVHTMSPL
jgi:UDPglucose--hexose-1-phosphate uridylyltransferase